MRTGHVFSTAVLAALLLAMSCSGTSSLADASGTPTDIAERSAPDVVALDTAVPDVTDVALPDAVDATPPADVPDSVQDLSPDVAPDGQVELPDATEEDTVPQGLPFSDGPYGTKPFDTAGPFVLPTTHGKWDFEKEWGGGDFSYVFLFYAAGYDYSEQLWSSPVEDLLKKSPLNVHYFFLSYGATAQQDVEKLEARFTEAMGKIPEGLALKWKDRLHFVISPPQKLGNWVTDVVSETGYFAFCIDRRQKMREVGLLADITSDSKGKMRHLAYEVERFNFEWDREEKLAAQQDVTVVQLFNGETFAGNGFAEAELPSAKDLEQFDTIEVDLSMGCPSMLDGNCGDWDYLSYLFLCDKDNPDLCEVELARWITAYKRQGRWVTDISPALVFLKNGGKMRFRYDASGQTYVVHMSLRFRNMGSGLKPISAIKLWGGGPFNQDYNTGKTPIAFTPPEGTKKAQIFAYITGHGFGNDLANCAEFCNHTHHFTLNGGKEFVKSHPEAGTATGCAARVPEGVVPNQFGTWPFGRGGWCPGWDVAPFVADVSTELVSGENSIDYEALFFGKNYEPKPAPNPNGFGANINMSSWLVFWG
jgi:hypothetical protein